MPTALSPSSGPAPTGEPRHGGVADRLAGWGEKYPDVPVQRLVAHGRPGHVLLDQAALAQLVVVGTRGHGEITGLLLDSVSNALVHAAACPVAIVRATEG